MRSTPVIAITTGDPCGIGPEVILKAFVNPPQSSRIRWVVIGDYAVFHASAKRLRCRLPLWHVTPPQGRRAFKPFTEPLTLVDCGHVTPFNPGRSSRSAGEASLAYLDQAIALWRHRAVHGLVTGPVTKWAIGQVDGSFVGHTEYLSRAMGARHVVMMFVSRALRMVLVTRHRPLSQVAREIDPPLLRTTLRLAVQSLREDFRIPHPTLALCGLNPHAGEAGRCGSEEATIMQPILRSLRRSGIRCDGPFAADGFFGGFSQHAWPRKAMQAGNKRVQRSRYDAVVCAYHDQGLIPFKMLARDRGCQLSVGLPIIRTSPDHGSALDIAGKGLANPGSMRYALALAARLVRSRSPKS